MTFLAGRLRWLAEGFEAERKEYLRTALFFARQAQLAYFLLVAVYLNAVLLCRSVTLEVVLVALRFPAGSPAAALYVYVAAFCGGLVAILVLVAVFELLGSVIMGRELLELKRADCHPNGMTGRLLYAAVLATRDEDAIDGHEATLNEDEGTLPLSVAMSDGVEAAFARAKRGNRIAVPQKLRHRVVTAGGKGAAGARRQLRGYDRAAEQKHRGSVGKSDGPAAAAPAGADAGATAPFRGRRLSVSSVSSLTDGQAGEGAAAGWQVRVGCQWWDWLMQLAVHVGLELGPLVAAVAVNVTSGRVTAALSVYVVTGGLLALLLTWVYAVVILAQVGVFLIAVMVDHCCCCCAEACCDGLTSPVLVARCLYRALMVVTCDCCGYAARPQASQAAEERVRDNHRSRTGSVEMAASSTAAHRAEEGRGQGAAASAGAGDAPAPVPGSGNGAGESGLRRAPTGLKQPGLVRQAPGPLALSLRSVTACLACWFDGGPLTSREHLAWFLGANERTEQMLRRKFEEQSAGYSCGMLGCQWHEHLCFSLYRLVLSPDAQKGQAVSFNPSRSALPGLVSVVVGGVVFVGMLAGVSTAVSLALAVALVAMLLAYLAAGLAVTYGKRCAGRDEGDRTIPEEVVRSKLRAEAAKGAKIAVGNPTDATAGEGKAKDRASLERQRSEDAAKSRLTGEGLLPWVDGLQTCCFYSFCCCLCPTGTQPSDGDATAKRAKTRADEGRDSGKLSVDLEKQDETMPCCGPSCRLAFLTPRHAVSWLLVVAAGATVSLGGWYALGQDEALQDEEAEAAAAGTQDDLASVPAEQLTAMSFVLVGLVLFAVDLVWIATMLPASVTSPIPGRMADDVREMHVALLATFLTAFSVLLGFSCEACAPTFQVISVIAAFAMLWRLHLLYDAATGRFSTAPWLAVVKQSYSLTRMAMTYTALFGEPWVVSDDTLQLLVGYAKLDPARVSLQAARKAKAAAPVPVKAAEESASGAGAAADDVETEVPPSAGKDGETPAGGAANPRPSEAWASFRQPPTPQADGDSPGGLANAEQSASAVAAQDAEPEDPAARVRALRRLPDIARRLLPGLRALVGSWETTSQMSWQNTPGFLRILETSVSPVPHPTGAIAGAGITLGIGLFVVLLVGSVVVTDQVHEATDSPLHGNSTAKPGARSLGRRYPVCDMGLDAQGRLSVMDAVLASQLAYRTSEAAFDSDFDAWFRGPQEAAQWTLRRRVNATQDEAVGLSDQPQSVLRYFVAEALPWNVRMVGVRGTTVGRDVVADLDIFAEGALLDAAFALLPGGAYVESDWKAWLAARVAEFSSPLRAIGVDSSVTALEGYLAQLAAEDARLERSMDTLLVGHSLGGAFALLVGARQDMRAMGVSSPGLGMTRGKFGVSLEALQRHGFSVHSTHDLISLVDEKVVPAQGWSCDLGEWGTAGCHMLDAPWETFSQSCGDPLGRTMLATTGERAGEYI